MSVGIISGIGLVLFEASPVEAVGGGAAAFAGAFNVGMKALSYIKRLND
ncbi:hypothetical protein [Streptomyces sp. UNOB3_S3]|nr:hypothetical protein [Streptomyces sp. UNOB3_S3]MCC3773678.1 hypothetical protein [Streptomyces sp. UNOB3_S3]